MSRTVALLLAFTGATSLAAAQDPCDKVPRRGGEIEEAIVGFQQAGASAAASAQNFFLDFYISRPTPFGGDPCAGNNKDDQLYGPRMRWWGNVRVASYPQQVSTSVASFVADFSSQVGAIPVNRLVQTAEFITGLEWRFAQFGHALDGNDRAERQLFALSVFGGGGASGPLQPVDTLQIYETPGTSSPQRAAFVHAFPSAANSKYIGFVSPDRDRFFRQFSAGLRLTTFYAKKGQFGKPDEMYLAAPAMISVSIGQNEMVTGGRLDGVVGRFEAFYPLLLWGDRSDRAGIIYLFGSAMLRLGTANQSAPFLLKQAGPDVHGYDADVAVVTSPSTRDTYLVGVGIELTQLFKKPASSAR